MRKERCSKTKVERRLVRVEISEELLLDVLRFPKGTSIYRCVDNNVNIGKVCLILEHPDLPIVESGKIIPITTPIFTHKEERYEFDWGLKNGNPSR